MCEVSERVPGGDESSETSKVQGFPRCFLQSDDLKNLENEKGKESQKSALRIDL